MTTTREVEGIVTTYKPFQMKKAPITVRMKKAPITVRWTSDLRGKTLSLAVFDVVQLTIPYEAIKDMVEEKK